MSAAKLAAVDGNVVYVGPASFTIQTPGPRVGTINALTSAADAIANRDYPYVWGGGHAQAGVASVGERGPGSNGRRVGYDCSGAVTAALAGASLWPAGSPVPTDAGVVAQLLRDRLIAPGAGRPPNEVTLYDDPGVHIFININGRFWGTSDGGSGGDRAGGAGWLSDGAMDASSRHFKRYHVLPSVLRATATYGQDYSFQFAANPVLADGLLAGDPVKVAYASSGIGTMNAAAITYTNALTASGTVAAVAADGSSITLLNAEDTANTYLTGGNRTLAASVTLGDVASLRYTTTAVAKHGAPARIAHSARITAPASTLQEIGTVTTIAADGSSFTIQTQGGEQLTLWTGGNPARLRGTAIGTSVLVSFAQAPGGAAIAEQVAAASGATGPTGSTGPDRLDRLDRPDRIDRPHRLKWPHRPKRPDRFERSCRLTRTAGARLLDLQPGGSAPMVLHAFTSRDVRATGATRAVARARLLEPSQARPRGIANWLPRVRRGRRPIFEPPAPARKGTGRKHRRAPHFARQPAGCV